MRAPVSIVVPTFNAAADLPASLSCLAEGLEAGLIRELIFTDGGSTDNTAALAEEAGAVLLLGKAGRGQQLRRGADAAEGQWLLFLHADTHLDRGWTRALFDHMRDHPEKAGHFRLGFRAQGAAPRMVSRWANLRSWVFGLPYGDQGLFVARKLYDRVGGYPEIPLMEDVALARALKGQILSIPVTAWTSAARYEADGWLRRGGRNLLTLARYLLGADPERLARSYPR
ncbi:MAG: TIGR04283 family arsenosugar biosynthesis glycosyltransferase [Pseudomonadota bacterium]